ncbi:hypothetical protein [Pleomorphovibrio marinus]|uniref:hypothetical protein n=1 Tax=Pleomorphovibrio marinus TaxID=2164132 RepID=UPI000E0BB4FC|nr:hypothetical protein [Pleomorphovibrio marinus]
MNKEKLNLLIEQKQDFKIGETLKISWEMFKQYPGFSMGYALFILSVQFLFVLYIPDFLLVFTLFLAGPLLAGFFLAANKISQEETLEYPDFFKGFQYYIPLVLVWLVSQVLVAIGLFALVLPGIYLMVSYMFAMLAAIFFGLDFWSSLEFSRKLVHRNWLKFFMFGLSLALLNLAGALVFLVGLAITLPLTYYAIYIVFEKISKGVVLKE